MARRNRQDVTQIVRELRSQGRGFYSIANQMMREGRPTPRGGSKWWKCTVESVLSGSGGDPLEVTEAAPPAAQEKRPPKRMVSRITWEDIPEELRGDVVAELVQRLIGRQT